MARSPDQQRLARNAARIGHAAQAGRLRGRARFCPAGLDRRHDGRTADCSRAGADQEVHGESRGAGKMSLGLRRMLLAGLVLLASAAAAHEMSMAEMELRQVSAREFLWQWTASGRGPAAEVLKPVWPEGCNAEGNLLRCGEAGLRGSLTIQGVGKRYSAALLKIHWQDGQTRAYTLTAGQPTVRLYGSRSEEHTSELQSLRH